MLPYSPASVTSTGLALLVTETVPVALLKVVAALIAYSPVATPVGTVKMRAVP
jgi:hypothetical protein